MAVIKYRDKQGKLQLVNIPISQVVALPEGNQNLVGKILQYTGETTDNYTNGYFYKCESTSTEGLYIWTRVNVQPAGGGTGGTSNYEDLENLPRINGVIIKGDKTLEELGINNFNGDYNNLINIPNSFTPSEHSHMVKDITDLDLNSYIEKQQGTENTGKILKVNEAGNLVLAEERSGNSVSVSAQGTSTDSVRYITVDGTEYLISGSTESSLSELTDVNLINITNGQILSYNSETSKWENIDAPSGTVVANPNEEIVKDLTKIKIDGTTYRIADDSIGKKVRYRFTTQSTGGNDASLNVTCDGTTKNYPYSTIRSNPLIVDGVFKLNYGLNENQWRVTCLGDKVYYNNNLMENNSIIKEWGYGESVDFEIYNFTGTINEIIPNPEGEGAENLTKISINGTVYNVASGGSSSSIVPNPEETATQKLSKIEIDGVNYYFSTDGTPSAIDKYSNKIFISTTYGDKFECNGRYFVRTSEKEVISFFLRELGSDNKNYYGYCLLAKNEEDLAGTNNRYGDLKITQMTGTNGKTIYKGYQSGAWGEGFNPSLNITSNSVTTNFSRDNAINGSTQLQEDSEFFNACVEYLYKEVFIGNADNIRYNSSVSNLGVGNVQEAIDKLARQDNIIVPNPETQSTEDLTKITINEVTYNIKGGEGGGSTVTPNPEDISAEAVELTGLRIDNNDYKITKESGNSQIYIGDEMPTDNNILIWINTFESYDPTVADNSNIWFSNGKFYNINIYGEPVYWNESKASIGLDESTGMIYINKNNLASDSNQAFIYMNNIISDEIKEKYSGIEIEYFVSAINGYGGTYGAKAGFFASKNTYTANEYKYLNVTDSLTILQLDFSLIPSGGFRYFGFGGNITGYIKSIKLIKK